MKKIIINVILVSTLIYSMGNDDPFIAKTNIHALEHRISDNEKMHFLDGELALGYDLKKVFVSTHLEKNEEGFEKAEVRAFYSFATAPYWNGQLGIRKDFQENGKEYISLGIDGLYTYFIDTEAVLFISTNGLIEARLALEHEVMVTQKLMLMIGSEISVFSKGDENIEVGRGLSSSEFFLKIMYAVNKHIVPYVGIHSENKYFNTRDMSEEKDIFFYTIGIHSWF